jgi:peroxiredoxin
MCAFRDSLAQLNQANAQVLGISVDLPYSLRQFAQAQNLQFPLLSDFDRAVISDYGVVNNNFNGFVTGVARRAVFVIDGDGKVTWEWLSDSPAEQPDYEQVLQAAGS